MAGRLGLVPGADGQGPGRTPAREGCLSLKPTTTRDLPSCAQNSSATSSGCMLTAACRRRRRKRPGVAPKTPTTCAACTVHHAIATANGRPICRATMTVAPKLSPAPVRSTTGTGSTPVRRYRSPLRLHKPTLRIEATSVAGMERLQRDGVSDE